MTRVEKARVRKAAKARSAERAKTRSAERKKAKAPKPNKGGKKTAAVPAPKGVLTKGGMTYVQQQPNAAVAQAAQVAECAVRSRRSQNLLDTSHSCSCPRTSRSHLHIPTELCTCCCTPDHDRAETVAVAPAAHLLLW